MTKVPRISGRECVKALGAVGFYLKRQEGSHLILRRDEPFAQVVVPDHKELDRGTLRLSSGRPASVSMSSYVCSDAVRAHDAAYSRPKVSAISLRDPRWH